MATNRLNPQQLDFLARYMKPDSQTYGNAQASALAAGYSESYATDILQQAPWLKEILGDDETLVTVKEIVLGIKAETTGEHAKDRLKAWELLGKTKRLFVDRTDHTTNGKELPSPIPGGMSMNGLPANDSDQEASEA
jgi:hypothetical protein